MKFLVFGVKVLNIFQLYLGNGLLDQNFRDMPAQILKMDKTHFLKIIQLNFFKFKKLNILLLAIMLRMCMCKQINLQQWSDISLPAMKLCRDMGRWTVRLYCCANSSVSLHYNKPHFVYFQPNKSSPNFRQHNEIARDLVNIWPS